MYSNIENVNILTSVLLQHGVRRVVVCPGSRNAPLVHNLNEAEGITCYPVTDERSAGFMALGMAMAGSGTEPVAVCVTSGSALLNLHPAVAEAYYQKLPLVVVSADRCEAWIGQQDGQTLPQARVFGALVNRSVDLPMIAPCANDNPATVRMHDEQAWYCERQAHEAIIDCVRRRVGPVHINIQIAEPLYEFTQPRLPSTHRVDFVRGATLGGAFARADLLDFLDAHRPMVVVGQDYPAASLQGVKDLGLLAVTLVEPTALGTESKDPASRDCSTCLLESSFELVLRQLESGSVRMLADDDPRHVDASDFMPDFILYAGGTLVSKRLKQFLRLAARSKEQGGAGAKVWRVGEDGEMVDTFMRVDRIFQCAPGDLAAAMAAHGRTPRATEVAAYRELWLKALESAKRRAHDYEPPYSSMAAVKYFQQEYLAHSAHGDTMGCRLFYGNSMPVRLAGIYASQYVHCCRGVNGIEGTLSAAAGLSVCLAGQPRPHAESQPKVFCVLGDLSFFYDQNALWNQNLSGSLRILLLNNGGGAIFGKFEGLRASRAREHLVMARHAAFASSVCQAYGVAYCKADGMASMRQGIDWLIHTPSDRPMLLEVFTDIDEDNRAVEEFFAQC